MKNENGNVNRVSRAGRKFLDKSTPAIAAILMNDWQTGNDFETATSKIVRIPCRWIRLHWVVSRALEKYHQTEMFGSAVSTYMQRYTRNQIGVVVTARIC